MSIRRGSNAAIKHLVRHGITFKRLYRGVNSLWQNSSPPTIGSFTANPSSFRIDQRATGNIVFNFSVTNATSGEIVGPDGTKLWSGTGGTAVPSYNIALVDASHLGRYWYPINIGAGTSGVTGQVLSWIGSGGFITGRNRVGLSSRIILSGIVIDDVEYFVESVGVPDNWYLSNTTLYSSRYYGPASGRVPTAVLNKLYRGDTFKCQVKAADGRYINLNTGVPESGGASSFPTSATLAQPTKTSNYRLTAFNATGSSHADTTVTVTKAPVISNFRSTGANHAPSAGIHGATFRFEAIIDGAPQPTLTADNSIGAISARHLTQRSDGRWDLSFTHYFGVSGNRTIRLTATNSVGTVNSSTTIVVP